MADYGSQLPDTTMLLKGIPQKIPEKDEDFVYGGIVELRDRSIKFLWKLLAQNAYKTRAYILEYEIGICARRLESFSFIHAVSIAHYKLALIRQLFQISIATFYKRQFIPSNPYVNSPYSGHHIDEEWPSTINISTVTFVDFIRDCTSFLKEKIRETRSNPNSQSSSGNSQDTTSQSSVFTSPPNSQNNNTEQLRRYAEILSLSTEEIAGIFPDLSAFDKFESFGRSEIPPEDTTIVQNLKSNSSASSAAAPEIYDLVENWSIASSPKNLTIASCSSDAVLEIDNEDENLVEQCSPKSLQIASFSSASELEIDCYIVSSPKSLKIAPRSLSTTLEINNVDGNFFEDCYIVSSPKNLKIASYSSVIAPEIDNVDGNLAEHCSIVSPRKNLQGASCSSQSISSKVPAALRRKANIKKKLTKRNLRSTSSMCYNLRRTKTEAVGPDKSEKCTRKKHSKRDKEDDSCDTKPDTVSIVPAECNATVDLDSQKYEKNNFQVVFLSSNELFNLFCSKISAEPTLDIDVQNNSIESSSSAGLLGFTRKEDDFQPMFESSDELFLLDPSATNSAESNVIVDIETENEEESGLPGLLGFTSEADGFQPMFELFVELNLLDSLVISTSADIDANNVRSNYTQQSCLPGLLGFTSKADGFQPMFNFSEELTELGFLGFAEYNIGTGADLMHLDCEFERLGSNVNLGNDNSNSEPRVAEAIGNDTEQIICTLSEPTEFHNLSNNDHNLLNLLEKSKKIESLHCNTHEVKQKNNVNQNANNALLESGEIKIENSKDTSNLTSPEIELNMEDTLANEEQENTDPNDLITYQEVTSTFMEDSEISDTVIQKISPQNNESVELAGNSSLPIVISDTENPISLESAQDLENTTTTSLSQESLNTPDLDVNQDSTHKESTGNGNLDEAIIESSQVILTSQLDLGIEDNLVSSTANNIVKQNANDMTEDLVPIDDNSKYSSDELSSLFSPIGGSHRNSFVPKENIPELPVDSTISENTTDLDVGSYIENLWQVIDSANTEVNYNIKTPDYKITSSMKDPNNINTELTEQVNCGKINDAENNQVVEKTIAPPFIQKSFSSGSSIAPQYSPLSSKSCSSAKLVGVPENIDIGNTEDNMNIIQSNMDNPEPDSDNAIIKNKNEAIDATSSNEEQNKKIPAGPITSPSLQESTSSGSSISPAYSLLSVKGCSPVQLEIDINNTICSSTPQKNLKISDEDNIDVRNINEQIMEGNEVEVSDIQDIVVAVSNISSIVQTDLKVPDNTDNNINSQNIQENSTKIVSTENIEILKAGLEIPITKLDDTSKNNQINSNNIELSEAPGLAPNTKCCTKPGCVCGLFNKLVSNEEFNAEFNTVDLNTNTDSENIAPELISFDVPDSVNTLNYTENDGPINNLSETKVLGNETKFSCSFTNTNDLEEPNEQLIKSDVVAIDFSASNTSVEKAETENTSTIIEIENAVFDSKSDIEIDGKTKQQNKHAIACKSSAKQHEFKSTGSSKCATENELKNLKHGSDSSDSSSSTNSDSESSSSESTSSSSSSDESMIQDNLELIHEQPLPAYAKTGDELTLNEKLEVKSKPSGLVDIESSNTQQNHQKTFSTQENTENISILQATSVQPGASKPISILSNRAKIYNDDYSSTNTNDLEEPNEQLIKSDVVAIDFSASNTSVEKAETENTSTIIEIENAVFDSKSDIEIDGKTKQQNKHAIACKSSAKQHEFKSTGSSKCATENELKNLKHGSDSSDSSSSTNSDSESSSSESTSSSSSSDESMIQDNLELIHEQPLPEYAKTGDELTLNEKLEVNSKPSGLVDIESSNTQQNHQKTFSTQENTENISILQATSVQPGTSKPISILSNRAKIYNDDYSSTNTNDLEEPNEQLIKSDVVAIDFSASNTSVKKAETENTSTIIEIENAVFDSKSDIEINGKTKQQNKHAIACKSSAKQHEFTSTGSSKCATENELKNLKHGSDSSDSSSSTNSDSESSSSESTSSSSSSDESMIQDNLELIHEQPLPEYAKTGDELTLNEKLEVNSKPSGLVNIESSNTQQNHQKTFSTQENTENISILQATSVQPGASKPISILSNRAKIYNDDYSYLQATKRFFEIEPLGLHIIKNDPFLSNYGTVNVNDSPNINTVNVAHEEIPANDDYIPESLNQAQLFDNLMILDDLNTNENCTQKYNSEPISNKNLKKVKTAVSIKTCTNNKQFKETILKTMHKKVNIKKLGILKPGISIKPFSNITSKQPNLKSILKPQVGKDLKIIKSAASIRTYTNKKISQQINNSQPIISSLHSNKFNTTRPAASIRTNPTNNTCEKVEKYILQLNNELTNKVATLEHNRNNSSDENCKKATTTETSSQLNIVNLPESSKKDNQKSTTSLEKLIGKVKCETSHLHKDLALRSDSDPSSDEPSPLYSPVGGNSPVLNENKPGNVHHIDSVVIDASMEPFVGTAEPKVFSFSQDLDIIPNELQFICPVPFNTQGIVNIVEPNSDNSGTSMLPVSSLSSITDCNTLQPINEIIKSCTVHLGLTSAGLVQVANTINDSDKNHVEVPSVFKDNNMGENKPGITVENLSRSLKDLKELNNTTVEKKDSKHDGEFVFSLSSSRNNNANSEDHPPDHIDDSNTDDRQASPALFENNHSLIKNPQEICPNAQTNVFENTDQKIEESVLPSEEDKISSENFKHDHCYLEALEGHDDEKNIEDASSQDDANISVHLHGVILDSPSVTKPSPVREVGSITEEESQRILYGPPAKTEEISESTLDQTTDHADKENAGPSSPQESVSDIDSILGEFLIFSDKKYKPKSKQSMPSTEESTPQLDTCIPDDYNDKTEQVNPEAIEIAKPGPKKRGRKPKPKPEGEKPPPKKRGRKPKPKPEGEVVKQPKKRGRPRLKADDETEDEGAKPPPKKRGRKPGPRSRPPVLGILQQLVGHESFVIESDEEYFVYISKIK